MDYSGGDEHVVSYKPTMDEALDEAENFARQAQTRERDKCSNLWERRGDYIEQKAKDAAAYQEAYTFICTYGYGVFDNTSHPAYD